MALRPYLAGISVGGLDGPVFWYETMFGFKLFRRVDLPEHGFRIAFLQTGDFPLELIEDSRSVSPKALLEHLPAPADRTRVQGFVKLAFAGEDRQSAATTPKQRGATFLVEPTYDRGFELSYIMVAGNSGNYVQRVQPDQLPGSERG